ncbi:MAG: hypothetical protein NTY46_05630 [Candidatus Sumerlaeota bacterium]|nr:hypothetical protein [Candidatus Sumerlaeota bacterium]
MTFLPYTNIAILAVAVVMFNSLFRWPIVGQWILGAYIVGFANIVAVFQIAGTVSLLNRLEFWTFCQGVLTVLSVIIWHFAGRPNLMPDFRRGFLQVWGEAKRSPVLAAYGGLIALALGFLFAYNFRYQQYIDDVLTAHLARVGHWLHRGNLTAWPADTYQMAQIVYPYNASAVFLWIVLLFHSDQLTGLLQWVSLPMAMTAIFGLSRAGGASRFASGFAALLFFTFPNVFMHGCWAMTDMTVTALIAITLYFLVEGFGRRGVNGALVGSAIALGLAVGTKQTVFFLTPFIVVFVLCLAVARRDRRWRVLATWCAWATACVLFLGSYVYVKNYLAYDNPTGPSEYERSFTHLYGPLTARARFEFVLKNCRAMWSTMMHTTLMDIRSFGLIAWPGPLFYICYFLGMCSLWFNGRLRRHWIAAMLGAGALVYMGIILYIRRYNFAVGRYMLPAMAMCMPVIAILVDSTARVAPHGRWRSVRIVSGGVCRLLMFVISLFPFFYFIGAPRFDPQNKLRDRGDFWYHNCRQTPYAEAVERLVPPTEMLAVLFPGSCMYRMLFGPHYERPVLPVYPPPKKLNREFMKRINAKYLLAYYGLFDPKLRRPDGSIDLIRLTYPGNYLYYDKDEVTSSGLTILASETSAGGFYLFHVDD